MKKPPAALMRMRKKGQCAFSFIFEIEEWVFGVGEKF